ncbi:MAG: hypothetical protein F6K26_48290 [Moorea sp. SIO2I5]|nr:hypothetical protein [Moorena sp. SIO2I5]
MELYIDQMLDIERPLIPGDHTPKPRPEAKTLCDRSYVHSTGKTIGNKPVIPGHDYSTIAWIPEEKGSWALPLTHERITSFDTPISKAAAQLELVCQLLPVRPITVWDSEYGCASFVVQTAHIPADQLMRLRPNRCLWGAPPADQGKGRPKIHGDKFKLSDSNTWSEPREQLIIEDPQLGEVVLTRWSNLHFRQSPSHSMEVIRVSVVGKYPHRRALQPMWLCWLGQKIPSLPTIWYDYRRRFAVDHWNRFAKQRLHWLKARFATPEREQRWSDLMPLMTWQLWLARSVVCDQPRPWQKSLTQNEMTPGRVAQSMGAVLAVIGSPASSPKVRGKSPGWLSGSKRNKRTVYPVVKKGITRRRKSSKKRRIS